MAVGNNDHPSYPSIIHHEMFDFVGEVIVTREHVAPLRPNPAGMR
jgi:hypothetical protein